MNEFLAFLWKNRAWWLVPLVLILAALAVVVYLTGESDVTPFIYPLSEP